MVPSASTPFLAPPPQLLPQWFSPSHTSTHAEVPVAATRQNSGTSSTGDNTGQQFLRFAVARKFWGPSHAWWGSSKWIGPLQVPPQKVPIPVSEARPATPDRDPPRFSIATGRCSRGTARMQQRGRVTPSDSVSGRILRLSCPTAAILAPKRAQVFFPP